jgi:Asp-tRNA(Asn)/Glu-tRNA(Gln) amidotransferase A subunit family amidase
MEDMVQAMFTCLHFELPRYLAWEYADHPEKFSGELTGFIAAAQPVTFEQYGKAVAVAEQARAWLGDLFREHDALMNAPGPGEAPEGLHSTGEPILNQAWSLSNSPCLTFPVAKGPKGLPVGIQLIGPRFGDARLLAVAQWARQRIAMP